MKPTLVAVLAVALASPVTAGPQGLLDQPQTFPWTVGLTPVVVDAPGGLAAGQASWKASTLWFNAFREAHTQGQFVELVDLEGVVALASAAWSPAPGWELAAQAQAWTLGPGVLDRPLAAFHRWLGVPNQGRDLLAPNEFWNHLAGAFSVTEPSWGATQASLSVRRFAGPWSVRAWLKPPVAGARDWGWSTAWGAGAAGAWGTTGTLGGWDWAAGATLGLGAVEAQRDLGRPLWWAPAGFLVLGGGYLTASPGPAWTALAQASASTVPRSGGVYLDQSTGLLSLGLRTALGAVLGTDLVGEVGFHEEFLTWATLEVGFHLAVSGLLF